MVDNGLRGLGQWFSWELWLEPPLGNSPSGFHSNGHSGGLRANIITFGAAMNGCHKAGEWQQVLQLFEDLQMKALQVRCPCCVASPTFFLKMSMVSN